MPDRRTILTGALALAAAPRLASAAVESELLWPKGAPGGEKVTVEERVEPRTPGGDPKDTAFYNITKPELMVHRPAKPNGAAVLLIPGGGFQRVAVRREGGSLEAWFADRGFATFMMTYRMPQDGWAAGADAPLHDAQRAMRLIRRRAASMGFDADKVAALGFSAGGHVAARLGARFAAPGYAPVDEADRLPTRPDALGLFFPVITVRKPLAHGPSARALVGESPTEEQLKAFSADENVVPDTPPTFIAAAADDSTVPPANSFRMFEALQAKKVPSELHIYEKGGHGLPVTDAKDSTIPPAVLLAAFLKRHGLTS